MITSERGTPSNKTKWGKQLSAMLGGQAASSGASEMSDNEVVSFSGSRDELNPKKTGWVGTPLRSAGSEGGRARILSSPLGKLERKPSRAVEDEDEWWAEDL